MPAWTPQPVWKGQDAILIGGGPSLKRFDFSAIKGRNVIGCNDAFRLGPEVVQLCLFGDSNWITPNKFLLEEFAKHPGMVPRVATCAVSLQSSTIPWLHCLGREKAGIHVGGSVIGWNFSTGAAAINLAISLGAVRIFLLGYDLGNDKGGLPHWHNYNDKAVKDFSYRRFQTGFANIHAELPRFPDVKVINVSDGTSKLEFFPIIKLEVFARYLPPQFRARCIECEKRAAQVKEAA